VANYQLSNELFPCCWDFNFSIVTLFQAVWSKMK
jgi:hypothetical protein